MRVAKVAGRQWGNVTLEQRGTRARSEPNRAIGGLTVDLYLPQHRLAVEVDFDHTHGTAHAHRSDARRDAMLRGMGIEVLRVDPSTSPP